MAWSSEVVVEIPPRDSCIPTLKDKHLHRVIHTWWKGAGDISKLDLPKWSEGSGFPGRPKEIAVLVQNVRGNSDVREEPGATGGRRLSTAARTRTGRLTQRF